MLLILGLGGYFAFLGKSATNVFLGKQVNECILLHQRTQSKLI